MTPNTDKIRINNWWTEHYLFTVELEKFLSHCPNMGGEDDRRDLCGGRCAAYAWCVSIEPENKLPPNLTLICPNCGQPMDETEVFERLGSGVYKCKNCDFK